MYGRVNYVTFKTDVLDEVVGLWPQAVSTYRGKGFVAGYFLLERGSGDSVSIVLFESETAMRANESAGDFRKAESQFREWRNTEPDKNYYEAVASVAANVSTPIGFARLARPVFKLDAIDQIVAELPAHIATYKSEPGFRGAHLLLNRETGQTVSLTLWGSRADCEANEASGAFQATVDPIADRIAEYPTRLRLDVAAVVEP
jgi:heme-degrading monooxygenase HmoA